jgi:hypothetical protein
MIISFNYNLSLSSPLSQYLMVMEFPAEYNSPGEHTHYKSHSESYQVGMEKINNVIALAHINLKACRVDLSER